MKTLTTRTLCSGRNVGGSDCRHVRLGLEPGEVWFCRHHEAQAGLDGPRSAKVLVSAVVPPWMGGENDNWYDGEPAGGWDWYW